MGLGQVPGAAINAGIKTFKYGCFQANKVLNTAMAGGSKKRRYRKLRKSKNYRKSKKSKKKILKEKKKYLEKLKESRDVQKLI